MELRKTHLHIYILTEEARFFFVSFDIKKKHLSSNLLSFLLCDDPDD